MKKMIVLLIVVTFIIISCQKKTIPVITGRESPKTVTVHLPPETIAPDTVAGKTIFIARCGRCHALPEPAEYTSKRWDGILTYMIPRARLTTEQGVHVTVYLKANAAK